MASRLIVYLIVSVASTTGRAAERPLVVAHRGLLRHAPENTLANFRACLELRLGFEFDVARTSDGHLVCIHDDTLDRTTNGTGRVDETSLAEMRRLDAGSWFDPAFAGERVPTVEEVFELIAEYRERNVLIAVDLKAAGVEADVIRVATRHRVSHRLLYIGRTISEPEVRRRLREASDTVNTAAVANDASEFAEALADPLANWVYVRFLPTADQIATVHRAGKRSFIAGATVAGERPENWRRATKAGIDAILTDFPLQLRLGDTE